jgi:hypothetical protein
MSEIGNEEQEIFWIRKLIKHTPVQHGEAIDEVMEYYEYVAKAFDYYEEIDEKESLLLFLEETVLKIAPLFKNCSGKDCIISFFLTLNALNNCPNDAYNYIDLLSYCKNNKIKINELDEYLMNFIIKLLKNPYNNEKKINSDCICIFKSLHILSKQIEDIVSEEEKDFYFYMIFNAQIKNIPSFFNEEKKMLFFQINKILIEYDWHEYHEQPFFNIFDLELIRMLSDSYQRMGLDREARVLLETVNYFETP